MDNLLLTVGERQQICAMILESKIQDAIRDWRRMAEGQPIPPGCLGDIIREVLESELKKITSG